MNTIAQKAVPYKILLTVFLLGIFQLAGSQSWDLTSENIRTAIRDSAININMDSLRPDYHLVPPVGSMGDPNGGIYYNGWYHMFYGLQPFSGSPGGWYWAHARTRDFVHWEHLPPGLTPAFRYGLNGIGSGSTIETVSGDVLAFYSAGTDGPMDFWKARFTDDALISWVHEDPNPVLRLKQEGIPGFDDFWRDPFVFSTEGRTFLIACADLLEEDSVTVPIFEASDRSLNSWEYKGTLFSVSKHSYRNLEVPEFRKIGSKWIFLASTDAPVDHTHYFIGEFDLETLEFKCEDNGPLDYSGHFYAQESITDDRGNLFIMAWVPGWDRDWLPQYMNEPLKNAHPLWNGSFSLPRKLELRDGFLIQHPVEQLKDLRREHIRIAPMDIPVEGPMTAVNVLEEIEGMELELIVELDLNTAAFCGLNVLCDRDGMGGLFIAWSGDMLNVDGVMVPIKDWEKENTLTLHVFIDKTIVEIFAGEGKYCITRQVRRENIRGQHVALTSLGGTARLLNLDAWKMKTTNGSSQN